MSWGRLDDKFYRHRKVRALRAKKGGREALGVWLFWWSWCLDDEARTGVVPASELPGADEKCAELLVEVRLWDVVPGGYKFHNFERYNPTKEKLEAKREADRTRVAHKRDAGRKEGAPRPDVARESHATSERQPGDEGSDSPATSERQPGDVADESTPPPAAGRDGLAPPAGARVDPNLSISQSLNLPDPTPLSARQRVCAGLAEGASHEERVAYVAALELRFRQLHMAAGQGDPATGGKETAKFPERFLNTARDLGENPADLLDRTFAAWRLDDFDGSEKTTPYSAFVVRFTRYAVPPRSRKGFQRGSPAEEYATGTDGQDVFGAMP